MWLNNLVGRFVKKLIFKIFETWHILWSSAEEALNTLKNPANHLCSLVKQYS